MVKKIVRVETNELTVDNDHLDEKLYLVVSHLLKKLLSHLYVDVEWSDQLVVDWCVQSCEQLTPLFLLLKLLLESDVSERHQPTVFAIEVDIDTRNVDLSMIVWLLGFILMLQIVWDLYVRLEIVRSLISCVSF